MKVLNKLFLGIGVAIVFSASAEGLQCFDFSRINTGIPSNPSLPAISADGYVKEQVIPLNGIVDNALAAAKPGDRICLKGTRDVQVGRKFFAYEFHKEAE